MNNWTMDEQNSRSISEFNGSQLKLLRIDAIIRGFMEYRRNMDALQMLFSIKNFDDELENSKTKEEKEELKKELETITIQVNSFIHAKKHKIKALRKSNQVPTELIHRMEQFYKKLLNVYKQSGLEQKLQSGALTAFGQN